jgi:ATP-dependent DNA helicase RecG
LRTNSPARVEVEKAIRILGAEARDGYRDQVVIGGLRGFVGHLASMVPDPRVQQACGLLDDYAATPPETRPARLMAAWKLLDEAAQSPLGGQTPAGSSADAQSAAEAPAGAPGRSRADASAPTGAQPGHRPRGAPPRASGAQRAANLGTPIEDVKGVGPQRAKLYKRLGLLTVRDLLFHYPTRHIPYPPPIPIADLVFVDQASVVGRLERVDIEPLPRGLKRMRALVRDPSGWIEAVWLRHGNPYLGIRPGESIALSGKLQQFGRRPTFDNPDFERGDQPPLHTRRLVPVYPSTAGLFDKALRSLIHWAVTQFASAVPDAVPLDVREAHDLLPLETALQTLHFPASLADFEAARLPRPTAA